MDKYIYLLFGFLALGLFSYRLGKRWTYLLMTVAIAVYVYYAYRH